MIIIPHFPHSPSPMPVVIYTLCATCFWMICNSGEMGREAAACAMSRSSERMSADWKSGRHLHHRFAAGTQWCSNYLKFGSGKSPLMALVAMRLNAQIWCADLPRWPPFGLQKLLSRPSSGKPLCVLKLAKSCGGVLLPWKGAWWGWQAEDCWDGWGRRIGSVGVEGVWDFM